MFYVFDRWGNQTNCLYDIIEPVHKDEVNGEDSLTLTLPDCDLIKGDRIVWKDKFGHWHEHTVNTVQDIHAEGKLYSVVYCENSIASLYSKMLVDVRSYNTSVYTALTKALSGTQWSVGTVDSFGTISVNHYHESAREAVSDIVNACSGEWETSIYVGANGVVSRKISIRKQIGEDSGQLFTYERNMESINRKVAEDDVVTRLYGYGKGIEQYDDEGNLTGGYSRKLTFGDINGGLDYVQDDEAMERWGTVDADGNKVHSEGKYENGDCEDMQQLLDETKAELEKRSVPQVSYTASVIDLADAGYSAEDSRKGDTVAIIDRDLGIRVQGRVLSVERVVLDEKLSPNGASATKITLGNITNTISDVLSQLKKDSASLADHASAWDAAASINTDYINAIINNLNNTINQTGGYTYYEPGEGIITYDKPKDQNPTMAIQIKGAGFRIADTKNSDGTWNWRTFGTGAGFIADLIVAGTLNASLLKAGRIVVGDDDDPTFLADFDSGEVLISGGTPLGDTTADELSSQIKASANGISLSVTDGSLGNTASIKITTTTVGGDEQSTTQKLNLGNVRSAFASDNTAITITAGTVTFNSNTFVVNSTYFKVSSTGVITATSGTIGGFTITSSSLYNGKSSLTSNTSGVYISTSGISVGSGSFYTTLADGRLMGGVTTSYTGYISFNEYYKSTGIYGVRIAGQGDIALYTSGAFGIGSYTSPTSDGTITVGQSASISHLESVKTWQTITNVVTNLSINNGNATWTNYTISYPREFYTRSMVYTKGLMTGY